MCEGIAGGAERDVELSGYGRQFHGPAAQGPDPDYFASQLVNGGRGEV